MDDLRHSMKLSKGAQFAAKFAEHSSHVVVPMLPLRRDDMMSDFSAEAARGERLYVCGQDESVRHTQWVLRALWQWVEKAAAGSVEV